MRNKEEMKTRGFDKKNKQWRYGRGWFENSQVDELGRIRTSITF